MNDLDSLPIGSLWQLNCRMSFWHDDRTLAFLSNGTLFLVLGHALFPPVTRVVTQDGRLVYMNSVPLRRHATRADQ